MKRKSNYRGKSKNNKKGTAFGNRRRKSSNSVPVHAQLTAPERQIINALSRVRERGLQSRALMREAGIKNKTVFYDSLRALKQKGEVEVDSKHYVTYTPDRGAVEATLVSLSAGFGFARPTDGGEDIFIHGSELKDAYVGDTIMVDNIKKGDKGFSGAVRRITEHSTGASTGTLHIDENGAQIIPDNAVRYNLTVKNMDLNGAKDGDKVLFTPEKDYRGDWSGASIKSVFGSAESARVCADAIIERFGIPTEFPKEVLKHAREISESAITDEEISSRLDLRNEPVFTIDGADAKDLDDAISIEKTANGYKLGVHIADVAHYVKGNSPIDMEAYKRGTSVYFADRVIPMLPVELSNGVCSLTAGTDKLSLSAIMNFDKSGNMEDWHFVKTIINSKVRGVYSEVNEIFAGTASEEIIKKYEPVRAVLDISKEFTDILKVNAITRGEMELDSGETKFVLDENGVCIDITPRTTGEAEGLIEQMMVSANIAAAKFSQEEEIPFLYRIHEKPQPERVTALYELLDSIGIACGELKKPTPKTEDFAAVLNRVKDTGKESLVSQRVLRTMEKAKYSNVELGHFGLSLADYSHFTSPIRRYPDTSIHRIITDLLAGIPKEKLVRRYTVFAENSASESSKNEVRAVSAERAAEDCYMAEYMKAHIGEHHTGIISGVTARGVFVKLANSAEGFVSLSDFEDMDFVFDGVITQRDMRSGKTLTVGDEMKIIVASAVVATGKIDFMPDGDL